MLFIYRTPLAFQQNWMMYIVVVDKNIALHLRHIILNIALLNGYVLISVFLQKSFPISGDIPLSRSLWHFVKTNLQIDFPIEIRQ